MTKAEILERHKETFTYVKDYTSTAIVCFPPETWKLLEDVIEDYEKQIAYWKLSFNKQVQISRNK